MAVKQGDDFGWPYCFHDNTLDRKVLAPEQGGDGKSAGRCARAAVPVIGFPGHWGPDRLRFYRGTMFPARYRDGAFIAFHGSRNRSPRPQAGYKVVFVPRSPPGLGPSYETFARRPMGRCSPPTISGGWGLEGDLGESALSRAQASSTYLARG